MWYNNIYQLENNLKMELAMSYITNEPVNKPKAKHTYHLKKDHSKERPLKDQKEELESDLKKLGLDIFLVKDAPKDGKIAEGDLNKITKALHDATKDGLSLAKAEKKIGDTVHNFSENVLDDPDLVIVNITNSGFKESLWQLYYSPGWESFFKLCKACSLILFPELPPPPPSPKPQTPPKVEVVLVAEVESSETQAAANDLTNT